MTAGQLSGYQDRYVEAIDQLAGFALELQYSDFPPEVTARLGIMVTDLLGVTAAGTSTPEMKSLFRAWNVLPGESPLIGKAQGTTPETAAYLNAVAACCLELDEGNKHAQGHPAVHVFFAAMAAAQICHQAVTGQRFLTAVVAGYEVAARFGRAFKRDTRWHTHGHWGAPGAACAAALIFGCTRDQLAAAIDASTALMQVTPWSTVLDGNFVRNFWAAGANIAGLNAARLARADLIANTGNAGQTLGNIMGELDASSLIVNLGHEWLITQGYSKIHSSCSYTHTAVDLIQSMKKREGISAQNVVSLHIRTHSLVEPLFTRHPKNRLSAMFSLPFVASAALISPLLTPETMDPNFQAFSSANYFSDKVTVEVCQEFDNHLPVERWTQVDVLLTSGRRISRRQPNPMGDVDYKPLDAAAINLKLQSLIGSDGTAQILKVVAQLPTSRDAKVTLRELLSMQGVKEGQTMILNLPPVGDINP